jgi:hypothetical protein
MAWGWRNAGVPLHSWTAGFRGDAPFTLTCVGKGGNQDRVVSMALIFCYIDQPMATNNISTPSKALENTGLHSVILTLRALFFVQIMRLCHRWRCRCSYHAFMARPATKITSMRRGFKSTIVLPPHLRSQRGILCCVVSSRLPFSGGCRVHRAAQARMYAGTE